MMTDFEDSQQPTEGNPYICPDGTRLWVSKETPATKSPDCFEAIEWTEIGTVDARGEVTLKCNEE